MVLVITESLHPECCLCRELNHSDEHITGIWIIYAFVETLQVQGCVEYTHRKGLCRISGV